MFPLNRKKAGFHLERNGVAAARVVWGWTLVGSEYKNSGLDPTKPVMLPLFSPGFTPSFVRASSQVQLLANLLFFLHSKTPQF
ncbi:hypothetical protein TsFJ059_002138 [Trichoderma semiorbis]|uniref:Uncharacterized protein n=1 Tax=Trichoderma semiorbis TaxID=1491008 RepID=A0A9P8HNL4_9HYPO|nr:hypothetical protein TsFJ059_002138 [Trichoderma semiorbis]